METKILPCYCPPQVIVRELISTNLVIMGESHQKIYELV